MFWLRNKKNKFQLRTLIWGLYNMQNFNTLAKFEAAKQAGLSYLDIGPDKEIL